MAKRTDLTRRNFLKLTGLAIAGAAVEFSMPANAPAISWPPNPFHPNEVFWRKVQKAFILDRKIVYMNIGTAGSMPKEVLRKYMHYNSLAAYHPRTFETELDATLGLPVQRETLAAQFGCEMDEICLSRNTTDGLDAIVHGLEFNAGDEILITHHEHIAALSPLNVIQDRLGVVVREVEVPVLDVQSAEEFVDAFQNEITAKTKAILFSHIVYTTGTRLPAKDLCHMARDNGLIAIVDGAHAPGMIQLNFHDMGCDFYSGSGHKWQCGPGATGFLYLRNHGDDLPTFWTQNSSLYTSAVQPCGNVRGAFDIAYSLQYRGQLNIPAHLAMVDACNMWEKIGRDRIEAYVIGLSAYLKAALRTRFGGTGTFFSPDVRELSSGLTAFNPFSDITDGEKVKSLVERLQDEAGYQVRFTNFRLRKDDPLETYALRISTHLFHNEHQIDGLVDAMVDLSQRIE